MRIRTSRIGLVSVRATAPVLRVDLSETHLEFDVGIDRVDSGNPLLDPELHALVRSLTQGVLTYRGRREGDGFRGDARAGEITVPLDLRADDSTTGTLALAGRCEFCDVDVPITWIGHLPYLAVDIDGTLRV